MAYHVYSTLGIVLEGRPQGDADKYYYIFTEELGLVIASAKSVRRCESKLRYGLNDFTLAELSFIRGKREWKITSARDIENIFRNFSTEPHKRDTALRILLTLRQFVVGEEQNKELFSVVVSALKFLKKSKLTDLEIRTFQCLITGVAYLDVYCQVR